MKLQPYRQLTVRQGSHHKLSSKYFRPFQVIERIRKVAYKLQLPHYANVNPVFHVFQLKPFYVEVATIGEFPQCDDEGLIAANPLKLLERKMVKQKNRMMFYGLIQWSNGEAENATYEKLEDIVSSLGSLTYEKMQKLQHERAAKKKEFDELTNTLSKSLWLRDLDALDHQLDVCNG
nr:hypothetical protein [Tanacetum cinerariifolium]